MELAKTMAMKNTKEGKRWNDREEHTAALTKEKERNA